MGVGKSGSVKEARDRRIEREVDMSLFESQEPVAEIRGVHLDLKGLPPTPERLLELLELFALLRLNCILVEWEDAYPWQTYPELRSETAYSLDFVQEFLKRARGLGLGIIPLVQSLGHMENVLSKEHFRHLRELPDDVSELCLSKPEGRQVLLHMIEDILATHQGLITHFHLGGDEAWNMGSCLKCRAFVAEHGKASLYREHVTPLLEALRERGLRSILWDDMMRDWPEEELQEIAPCADLMAWSYAPDPFQRLRKDILDRYAEAGITLWGASAFKGADGAFVDLPDVERRAVNLAAWAEEAGRRSLAGLIATGWSRYNTFLAPCEGLESSLDCLVLAGASMWDGTLQDDFLAEARSFLDEDGLRESFGSRFRASREASKNLTDWRRNTQRRLESFLGLANLAGESERCNPRRQERAIRDLREELEKGEGYGHAWTEAHAGLVPRLWLDRYVASRLLPLKRLVEIALEQVEG